MKPHPLISSHPLLQFNSLTCYLKHCEEDILAYRVLGYTDTTMQLINSLMLFVSIMFITVLNRVACKTNPIICSLWTYPKVADIFMNGDFILGGIFAIHDSTRLEQIAYTRMPPQLQCSGYMQNVLIEKQ